MGKNGKKTDNQINRKVSSRGNISKPDKGNTMKMNKIVGITAALMLTAGMARAAHIWEDPGGWAGGVFVYDTSGGPRYTAQELSLDAFGSYVAGEHHLGNLFDTNIRHGIWGGGVGLNYFITPQVGISGDINIGANGGNFVDQAIGNLVFRWPIEPTGFAPYIFGGGGRGFDPAWEWLADLGVGFEYRFNPATGFFLDGRYIWADHVVNDRLMLRAGLRLVF